MESGVLKVTFTSLIWYLLEVQRKSKLKVIQLFERMDSRTVSYNFRMEPVFIVRFKSKLTRMTTDT